MYLYKTQIVNILTQETLMEYVNRDLDIVSQFIEACKATAGKECFIFDQDLRTYRSHFISHSVTQEGMDKVYKFFFEANLSEITA